MQPKNDVSISLIVPFFNSHEKIDFFLQSLLAQELSRIEVIFVDDGSTDETSAVIENYLDDKCLNYKLLKKTNGGVSSARNLGLKHACGKYVMFVDSDDALLVDSIVELKLIVENDKQTDCFLFEYVRFKESYRCKALGMTTHAAELVELERNQVLKFYLSGDLIQRVHMCSCLYRLEFLKSNNISFDESFYYGEDQKFVIESLVSGQKIRYAPFSVLAYIDYPTSATGKFNNKWFDSYKMFRSFYEDPGFKSYQLELENRLNGELLAIANKVILAVGWRSASEFIQSEVIPLKVTVHKKRFYLLFNFTKLYALAYQIYRNII